MSQPRQGRNSRFTILLYKVVSHFIAPVSASPFTTSTQPATSSSTSSSATASTTSSGMRDDSSFQGLATGTQDLAALVGIFATDSVERYAFDYTKGHLSSAVSMLSLLGILGYVRALVKLGLGPKACENAGFDMKALRPMVGVSDTDRLPADEIYELLCIERLTNSDGSRIQWNLVRNTKHTTDSSALGLLLKSLSRASHFEIFDLHPISRRSWQTPYLGGKLFNPTLGVVTMVLILLVSLICFGLNSLLVVPLRATSQPTWSLYFATVGILVPTYCSSIAWAWVLLKNSCHILLWTGRRPLQATLRSLICT